MQTCKDNTILLYSLSQLAEKHSIECGYLWTFEFTHEKKSIDLSFAALEVVHRINRWK
jgi:hypothetical protein